ncbi:MAG: bifunctional serine/threonine-protein kinase/formylglycine-generating enzyme family protein [Verrucomicrobiales bacterium]|nr:bifunctional serine/threonine-protein kinase/formylglycine-generating enzyme family protein [Verrucomicrobiales bacterium]
MPEDSASSSNEPILSPKNAAKLMRDALLASDSPDDPSDSGAWVSPPPEELNRLMPGYAVDRIIGRGGMGAVYHAIQSNLDREVAIKLLPPELSENPEFEARFKGEAKSMARLNHTNIVQIYDFGETTAGHHYISLEYVDGADLQQIIQGEGLPHEETLNVISQICDALEYAHSEGFVHRDIKPANMFINSKGILKVGDFGLAKLMADGSAKSVFDQSGLTLTGVAMGTPNYIAPEQLEESGIVDQRADLFSLGIMFYEMLTGEIPRGAVKFPSEKSKHLDVRIDGIVFKAMEPNPVERYQSATDFRADVDAIRNNPARFKNRRKKKKGESSRTAAPSKERRLTPLSLLAMLVIPALLLGGIIYALKKTGAPTESTGTESHVSSPGRITSPVNSKPGYLHGLVYDKINKKVVPTWIPAGFKQRLFTSVGATPSNGNTYTTAFSWWAITAEKTLFSTYNKRQMPGTARQPNGVLSFRDKVGVSIDGTLIANPDFFPPPTGANFVDAQWGTDFAIALAANGHAVVWKSNNHNGQLFQPPVEALRNVRAISTDAQIATVLSQSGKVIQWHSRDGLISNALTRASDIVATSSNVSIDKNGKMHSEVFTDLNLSEKAVDLNDGHDLLALKFESGDWRLYEKPGAHSTSSEELIAAFQATPKRRVIDLFVSARGDQESAILIWLEEGRTAENENLPTAVFPSAETGSSSSPLIQSATKTNPYENSLGMQFLPVPIRGGPSDGQKILFSKWETRVSDYRTFHGTDPNREWLETDFPQTADHPAVRMPYTDAVAFCDWLTEKERNSGRLQANEIYRLPSDHEWSCAAGIGHLENPLTSPESKECRIPGLYFWGRESPPPDGFGNFYGHETEKNPYMTPRGTPRGTLHDFEDAFDRTSPVGSFTPNDYGLFDMEGNVFEWCRDWFSHKKERKALRGASWGVALEHNLLISSRIANSPSIRFGSHGFRCVLAVEE